MHESYTGVLWAHFTPSNSGFYDRSCIPEFPAPDPLFLSRDTQNGKKEDAPYLILMSGTVHMNPGREVRYLEEIGMSCAHTLRQNLVEVINGTKTQIVGNLL